LGSVSEISEGQSLSDYAQLCGRTLARAHARSGDPAAIAGYTGKSEALDDAIASFAMAYADHTNTDYAALVKAKGSKPVAAKKSKAA
jgi:predicted alpha/beta hydrolase